jgi:hypothetical protein
MASTAGGRLLMSPLQIWCRREQAVTLRMTNLAPTISACDEGFNGAVPE